MSQGVGRGQGRLFEELRTAPQEDSALARELAASVGPRGSVDYSTTVSGTGADRQIVDTFTGEFWTSAQRKGHSLHEVSYRACFKPQLPAFFIDRLSGPGDLVYDPFLGRGTTLLEAALRGRVPCGTDINPLSKVFIGGRLRPPTLDEVAARLEALDLSWDGEVDEELGVFYHPQTLRELHALRHQLLEMASSGRLTPVDDWIRMVAINRLTGHSPGFFSVYTMPPNQAVSVTGQRRINERRAQVPPRRMVKELILRKSRSLLAGVSDEDRAALEQVATEAVLLSEPADRTPQLPDASVQLVVTSPPFLDVVQYQKDNWLRCWFCGIDADAVPVTMMRTVEAWQEAMASVFAELFRIVRPGGHVAFEVGEVRRGTVRLEEAVIPAASRHGFAPELVLINSQEFTKTANCWGINNNVKGTNSNRVVVLRRP